MSKNGKLLFKTEELVVGLSAILLVIAAFLTWAQTPHYAASGLVGDGIITFAIGAVAIIFLIVDLISEKIPAWIPLILGIIAAGIVVVDYLAISEAVAAYEGSVGYGLYLTGLASLGIIVGSILDIKRNK